MTVAHPQVHEMHLIRTAIMTPKSTFGTHILEHIEEMEFVHGRDHTVSPIFFSLVQDKNFQSK